VRQNDPRIFRRARLVSLRRCWRRDRGPRRGLPRRASRRPSPSACSRARPPGPGQPRAAHRVRGRAAPESLHDMDWLQAKVSAHEHVLEAVLPSARWSPCASARSTTPPPACARRSSCTPTTSSAPSRAWPQGRVGVKVYSDLEALSQGLGEVSDLVKRLRADLATKPPGAAYSCRSSWMAPWPARWSGSPTSARRAATICSRATPPVRDQPLQSRRSPAGRSPWFSTALPGGRGAPPGLPQPTRHAGPAVRPLGFSYDLTGRWRPTISRPRPGRGSF